MTLALLSIGSAWAADEVIGYTEAINGTKLDGRVLTGGTHVTIGSTPIKGSSITDYKGTSKSVVIDGTTYASTDSWRKSANGTYDNQNVGYILTVESGYKMNVSHVSARIAVADDTYTWYVNILNGSGTEIWKSGEKTSKKSATSGVVDADVTDKVALQGLTGNVTVQLWVKQGGTTKYYAINYLQLTVSTEVDDRATYDVTTSATAGGTVNPDGTNSFTEGEDVVLTATPSTGYKFIKWTVDGVDDTTNPYTISSIAANHTAQATFEALPKITFGNGGDVEIVGTLPATDYAESGTKFTVPSAYFLTKSGFTLTGWNDGTTTYTAGDKIDITGDVALTPVFTTNTVALGDADAVITWPLATDLGCPVFKLEGNTGYYVKQATIGGNTLDVAMFIDTQNDAGISGKRGKVDIQANRAQVNAGTVFTIPAVTGMVVTVTVTNTGKAAATSMTFNGDNADAYNSGANTLEYTYGGDASTLTIIDQGNDLYPSKIEVSYPNPTEIASITAAGYASYVPTKNVSVPTGVEAFIVTATDGGVATLAPISVIAAGTPVIIKGNADDYAFTLTKSSADDASANLLKASTGITADGTQYILANGGSGVGFYKATPQTEIAAGVAYLVSPSGSAPYFIFGIEGGTTGIDAVQGSAFTVNGEYYNLAGQRVAQPTKGLYIVNGKKVVVK